MEPEPEPEPEIVHRTEFHINPFHNDEIHTTVTSDRDTVVRWVNEIERPNLCIVSVDIMCQYNDDENRLATLQLCVGSRCLVYLLEFANYDFPDVLLDFLVNEEYTFVGWDIDYSLLKLEELMGLNTSRMIAVELKELAEFRFSDNIGMSGYNGEWNASVNLVLGREVEDIPQEVMELRWDQQLTAEQVKYASINAFVAFEMGRILDAHTWLHRQHRRF